VSVPAAASITSPGRCFRCLRCFSRLGAPRTKKSCRNDFQSLRISRVGSIGLALQFETQHKSSEVIYVQGGGLIVSSFKVISTRFELKKDFSSLDIHIFPESLVEQVCTTISTLSNHATLEVTKGKKTIFPKIV